MKTMNAYEDLPLTSDCPLMSDCPYVFDHPLMSDCPLTFACQLHATITDYSKDSPQGTCPRILSKDLLRWKTSVFKL